MNFESEKNIGLICGVGSLGDHIINLQALYTLKTLYPKCKVHFICMKKFTPLFENLDFIDKVSLVEALENGGGGGLSALDILLLGRSYKQAHIINAAKSAKIKLIISPFWLKTLFDKQIQSFFYLQTHKCLENYKILKAVRSIDKRHFDENFKKIDFSKARLLTKAKNKVFVAEFLANCGFVKRCLQEGDVRLKNHFDEKNDFLQENKSLQDRLCKDDNLSKKPDYKKLVGINAFGISNPNFKFEIKDWVELAKILASTYPQVLFVMMNFKGSGYEFAPFNERNIKVFVNDEDLLNLVELTSHLDLLITVDTGNVHIADVFQVPILELIKRAKVSFQWCGGAWGNECECVTLPKGFKKRYNFHKKLFFDRALKRVKILVES